MLRVAAIASNRLVGRTLPVAPPRPPVGGAPVLDELVSIGRRNRTGEWPLDGDLADARNAHATNRLSELRAALAGDHDWLEVDVRVIDGVPTASHDRRPASDALRMTDWIRIGAATRRGLKLDFKERAAIAPTLDLVRAAGVPDERLVINVPILARRGLTLAQLQRIRDRFPRATINLCLGPASYSRARVREGIELARSVGGPISFPLDLARADRATVTALRTGGHVAIWNDPRRTPVRDIAAMRRELRGWGVDGTIDLR